MIWLTIKAKVSSSGNDKHSEGFQIITARLMEKVKRLEKDNKELLEKLNIKVKELLKLNSSKLNKVKLSNANQSNH